MGMQSFLGPIRGGTVHEGSLANMGLALFAQSAQVSYTDTSAKNLFILPAGAQVLNIMLDVVTAFNAGTTNVLDIGTSANGALFVNDAAVGTTVHTNATLVPANLASIVNIGSTDLQVTATYVPTGTASSAGAAIVSFLYVLRNTDGTVNHIP